MLDAARILADDQRREILDRADDGAGLEFERRLAEPDEPGNVGLDANENPVAQLRVDDDSLDRGDLHPSSSAFGHRPVSDWRRMRRSMSVCRTTEITMTRPKASWV